MDRSPLRTYSLSAMWATRMCAFWTLVSKVRELCNGSKGVWCNLQTWHHPSCERHALLRLVCKLHEVDCSGRQACSWIRGVFTSTIDKQIRFAGIEVTRLVLKQGVWLAPPEPIHEPGGMVPQSLLGPVPPTRDESLLPGLHSSHMCHPQHA